MGEPLRDASAWPSSSRLGGGGFLSASDGVGIAMMGAPAGSASSRSRSLRVLGLDASLRQSGPGLRLEKEPYPHFRMTKMKNSAPYARPSRRALTNMTKMKNGVPDAPRRQAPGLAPSPRPWSPGARACRVTRVNVSNARAGLFLERLRAGQRMWSLFCGCLKLYPRRGCLMLPQTARHEAPLKCTRSARPSRCSNRSSQLDGACGVEFVDVSRCSSRPFAGSGRSLRLSPQFPPPLRRIALL